jgi:hypothetical protein
MSSHDLQQDTIEQAEIEQDYLGSTLQFQNARTDNDAGDQSTGIIEGDRSTCMVALMK